MPNDSSRLGDALPRFGTDAERLQMAIDHASNLAADERPEVPVRPASLPNDEALIEMHERQERGERLGATDEKALNRLGMWRHAVFKHESKCAGKMLGILHTWRVLSRGGETAAAERVATFLHVEYGIESVPADANDDRELAQRKASRVDVLPLVLRTMKRDRRTT